MDMDQEPGMLMNIKIAGCVFVPSKSGIGGLGVDSSCRHENYLGYFKVPHLAELSGIPLLGPTLAG